MTFELIDLRIDWMCEIRLRSKWVREMDPMFEFGFQRTFRLRHALDW